MSFTWIPLYEDIATRLLDYEHRQPELLAFLTELKGADLPMASTRARDLIEVIDERTTDLKAKRLAERGR